MATPLSNFEGITKGSAFSQWVRDGRGHLIEDAEAVDAAAEYLKAAILRTSKWPFAVDKRMAARRIHRAMKKAAEFEYDAAKCLTVAHREYMQAFTKDKEATPQNAFDPNGA